MRRAVLASAVAILLLGLAACGGGAGSSGSSGGTTTPPPINNTQPVVIDAGPTVNGRLVGYNDSLYTTVTICVPGTATCQSIDHVLVDTGSTGLRIISSEVTLSLPYVTGVNNTQLGNCIQYADSSYQWGPVVVVDVKMAGEVASAVPVQIVGPTNFPAVPSTCSTGGTPVADVTDLGARGILGVGNFRQDCGPACASLTSPPAVYFNCTSSACTPATVAVSAQLQNPVWLFPQDNNGLAIVLPQVGATGALTVAGSMIFGIGTQSDNGLNGAQAQAVNLNTGNFTTTFNGVPYATSYIDSGSSGYFFLDSTITGLPDCSGNLTGFYCPGSPVNLMAITSGPNPNGSAVPVSANIAFSVGNASALLLNSPNNAFNNLGGDDPGVGGKSMEVFDWGLPFFFGRTVFIGIEGQSSPAGTGPYWAY